MQSEIPFETIQKIDVVPKLLEVVCRTTGMGFSAVAKVTDTRWIACAVRDEISFGLIPGGELKLESTICHEIRQHKQAVVIDNVADDPAFCNHHTPTQYGFQSYISVPITLPDGRFFGTLCAIDPRPAKLQTPEVIGMFTLFADLIAQHLDAQDRHSVLQLALEKERRIALLRDQFIAVLGHDLRNPLGAILTSAELLKVLQPNQDTLECAAVIQSSGKRMIELIENVLDFARSAMGGGIGANRQPAPDLQTKLNAVIHELQLAWPGRKIVSDISLSRIVSCDPSRISQVLSNLLANAIVHGEKDKPVEVCATIRDENFELSVKNFGPPIPPEIQDTLFEPFVRGKARTGGQGLGLGLYISSEIAREHNGTLSVISYNNETQFTFQIPIAAPKSTTQAGV